MSCRSLVLLFGLVAPALAQAPRITPAGDPSIRGDTIYSLAVNPADHPGQPFIYLLDDGVVRYEADGRGSRTYRQIVQVLTPEAVERWGEYSFSYSPGRERLTVNWIRVVRPNGEVISDKPVHEQESLSPAAQEAPVYTDQRVRQISVGGVAANTIVDYSYTVETLDPFMPRDFYSGWRITTGRLTRRSRFMLDVPQKLTPRIREVNVGFPRREWTGKGRHVYEWATAEVQPIESEPFAADSNGVVGYVNVSAPIGWNDVARWYADLSEDRYALSPALEDKVKEILRDAASLDDSLKAVHRWVAQDFRYVSLSLGIGGYRPRQPADVLATQYGDCKDKATLFVALARRMGVTAYPVLLSSNATAERELPSTRQFDHMIAAVERPGGRLYMDLTADLTPYGSLPPDEQGGFALVVHPDGSADSVMLPQDSVTANRSDISIVGELSPAGVFSGRFTRVGMGSRQYPLRQAFTHTLTATERTELIRALANSVIQGASGDSLVAFDGRDLGAPARVSLAIQDGRVTSSAGGLDVLTLPIDYLTVSGLIQDLASHVPRRFPIDPEGIFGAFELNLTLQLTLPEGWRARIPADV